LPLESPCKIAAPCHVRTACTCARLFLIIADFSRDQLSVPYRLVKFKRRHLMVSPGYPCYGHVLHQPIALHVSDETCRPVELATDAKCVDSLTAVVPPSHPIVEMSCTCSSATGISWPLKHVAPDAACVDLLYVYTEQSISLHVCTPAHSLTPSSFGPHPHPPCFPQQAICQAICHNSLTPHHPPNYSLIHPLTLTQ